FHNVVCVRTVSENILSAEKHLQFCVFKTIPEFSQPVPGIFLQETKRRVKCSAAPAFYCMVAYLIHLIYNGQHLFCCHSGGNQGLMRVTQNGFCYFYRFFCCICHYFVLHILLNTKDCHKCSCYNCCSDYTGHIRSHSMHEKEIGRISFSTYFLGNPGGHGHRRHPGRSDQRIDLAFRCPAEQFSEKHTCRSPERQGQSA